jgi:hypothetical protein
MSIMTNTGEPEHILLLNGHGRHSRLVRATLTAGIVGPIILGVVIGMLTVREYTFMRGLGWHPINAPTTDWPSGLALGPYGWIMVVTFVGSGSLLILFSFGMREALPGIRSGPVFLVLAGVGMMLLGFKVDPTYRTTPATVYGTLHDIAFAIMGLSFLGAFVSFGYGFRRYEGWQGFARYSWLSALVVLPAITLKELIFYVFLLNTLAWVTYLASRLRRITTQ